MTLRLCNHQDTSELVLKKKCLFPGRMPKLGFSGSGGTGKNQARVILMTVELRGSPRILAREVRPPALCKADVFLSYNKFLMLRETS